MVITDTMGSIIERVFFDVQNLLGHIYIIAYLKINRVIVFYVKPRCDFNRKERMPIENKFYGVQYSRLLCVKT